MKILVFCILQAVYYVYSMQRLIDSTIKLTLFSWLFLKNNVKLHNKEIKKRFLVLFASNSFKSVLAKPFRV